MPYSTYEDARARESELMRSARRVTVGTVPREERKPLFRLSRVAEIVLGRHDRARKPADSKA